jgi:chromate transporter
MNQLAELARVFAYLSLLTVGGGVAAFPELKTVAVDAHNWLTFPQLFICTAWDSWLRART